MSIEALNGVWKYKSSENFDEYMKAVGVGFLTRKVGNFAKPTLTITITGDSFYMHSQSVRSFEFTCKLGEEFDEAVADGRKCKSTISWDGSKLVHVQKWDGKESTITRWINEDGNLVMELVMNDVKCVRVYTK